MNHFGFLLLHGGILNGLQAVKDLAWGGKRAVYRTIATGHPQGCAPDPSPG